MPTCNATSLQLKAIVIPVNSYAQLASISTEVKKAAKKLPGSSVVINRRIVAECIEATQGKQDGYSRAISMECTA